MTGLRVVLGKQPAAGQLPRALLSDLVMRIADYARQRGFSVGIEASRSQISQSRYLHLHLGTRPWMMRVSDHRKPRCTGAADPHFDLVSLDGRTGFDAATAFIDRVASGEQAWFEAGRSPARRHVGRKAGYQKTRGPGR